MKAINEKLKLEIHLQNAAQKLLNLEHEKQTKVNEAKLVDVRKRLDEQTAELEAVNLAKQSKRCLIEQTAKERGAKMIIQEKELTNRDNPTKIPNQVKTEENSKKRKLAE